MGSATRSILQGLQIGGELGAPLARGLQAMGDRDFKTKQAEEEFRKQVLLKAAMDPEFAASLTQPQETQVDGQKALRALPVSGADQATIAQGGQVAEQPRLNIGGQLFDPQAYRQGRENKENSEMARSLKLQAALMQMRDQYDASKDNRGLDNDKKLFDYKSGIDNQNQLATLQKKFELAGQQGDADSQRSLQNEMTLLQERARLFPSAKAGGPKLNDADTKFVDTLASKNANKVSIANQLQQFTDFVTPKPGQPAPDEKTIVKEGQRLIKVLNSSEGQDAVGKDEAERLGSMLDFKMGNLGNLFDPTQKKFGRDIEGFKNQIAAAVDSIRSSTKANDAEIGKIYNKYGIGNAGTASELQGNAPIKVHGVRLKSN